MAEEKEVIVDDIPDIEVESLDYLDEGELESEEMDEFEEGDEEEPKDKKPEDDADSDDDAEDEEDDAEDSEEEPDEDPKDKVINVGTLRGKERSNKDYKEAADNLESLSEEFEELDSQAEPVKPKKDQYGEIDEDEMQEYRTELAIWRRDIASNQRKAERLQGKMRKAATKAQIAFLKDFPEARSNGFEQFVAGKRLGYLSWTTGERSLYSLYREHLEDLDILDDVKTVKKLKKERVKIKPTSHKAGSAAKTKGTNGLSSTYKYANMPMFKDYVKATRGTVSPFTKKRMTDQELEKICKQEYRLDKGYSIV